MRRWVVLALFAIVLLGCAPGGALAAASPSGTIAGAQTLSVGETGSGGGGTIDFWKLHLRGGDQVVINVNASKSGSPFAYHFELYAPEAADDSFASLLPADLADTGGVTPKQLTLQAPYTGTFFLTVCEVQDNQGGAPDCGNVHPPGGEPPTGSFDHPMDAYTFTTALAGGVTDDQALSERRASPTITGAPTIAAGDFGAGGGGTIDFWKIQLRGGDQVVVNTRASKNGSPFAYHYELYATDGMTDDTFASLPPFDISDTGGVTPKQLTLQAPYTGQFLLVVCEVQDNQGGAPDCRNAHPPGGAPPNGGSFSRSMNPYTFTTTLSGGITDEQAASETRARPTLAAAPTMSGGDFEAGGSEAIDFWKISLQAGDQLVINTRASRNGSPFAYHYELYPNGMTDDGFASTSPLDVADSGGVTPKQLTLVAPSTGVFVLAVCQTQDNQGGIYDCRGAHPPGGEPPIGNITHPMNPYTFATSVTAVVDPSATQVACSPSSVTVGTATTCVATVTDTATSGATSPSGTVTFTGAPSLGSCVLTATGAPAAASCQATFTPSAPGASTITADYGGDATHNASTGQVSVTATAVPAPPTQTPTHASTPPAAGAQAGTLTIGRAVTVRRGVAGLSLSCSGAPGASCAGTLTLTITVKTKHKVHGRVRTVTRALTIGSASYRLTGGAATTVAVKLSAPGLLRLATRHHVLKAKLSATVRGSSPLSATVTLTKR